MELLGGLVLNFFRFSKCGVSIHSSCKGLVKEFVIAYPQNKGKGMDIGPSIIKNLLKEGSAIIEIDSSLCFSGKVDIKASIVYLKDRLNYLPIPFEYRIYKKDPPSGNPLSKMFSMNVKQNSQENIVFELPKDFEDDKLLEPILNLGCFIYFPAENEAHPSLVQRILNGHFRDDESEGRYDIFKFIMYINNVIKQASLKTTCLDLKDVERICRC